MEFFLWFIFWGVVCAIMASSRGRNAIGWFFLGALISPLAAILLLVLPNLNAEASELSRRMTLAEDIAREAEHKRRLAEISAQQAKAASADTRECPYCAEIIKRAARICRFCNRDLPEVLRAQAAEKPSPNWEGVQRAAGRRPICGNCHEGKPNAGARCFHCGSPSTEWV